MLQRPTPTSDNRPCDLPGQGRLPFPGEPDGRYDLVVLIMLDLEHEAGKHTHPVKYCRTCAS